MMKEKKSEIESDNQLWTSNASFVALLSENKVTFLLKIIGRYCFLKVVEKGLLFLFCFLP